MLNAIFINKLPVDVKINWSNQGGKTNGIASSVCTPNGMQTFGHGWASSIEYGLFAKDAAGDWTQFDQDDVMLSKDRTGEIKSMAKNSVEWSSLFF